MRIIKEGIPNKKFYEMKLTGKCDICKCEFEFTKKDTHCIGANNGVPVYSIACPWCRNKQYLHISRLKNKEGK